MVHDEMVARRFWQPAPGWSSHKPPLDIAAFRRFIAGQRPFTMVSAPR
jgi:hypothetical protein